MDCSFLSLEEKVAIVTGGSRGIGKAIALAFADAGADVAIASRKLPDLEKVAEEIEAMGRKALCVPTHTRKVEDLRNLVSKVVSEFGRIDVLVNNAATNPAMGPIVDTEESVYDHIMETNLKGYFVMSQLVGKIMRDQKSGVIINVSSAGGLSPAEGLGPYCISKAGINMLTKALALELGPYNVRVNAIAPRIVKTDFSKALWTNEKLMEMEYKFTPLKCVATPEEIAQTALYLASTATNYMTGHIVVLNGGAFF
ncbi:MAG: SDR family oxidoreductase [Deltaproteobacteria bacterium]|nr:SDR family oxidoreductase [Deltaproteobacteria bacterium]MBW1920500.1 SDR family oxidoreductase [Deltaproteobacteria bacterium]MBW1936771.1 SDR family oxidoreductase [Deltaproteobacteria bacterium]